MFRTFNMGIGFILTVNASEAEKSLSVLKRMGEIPFVLGEVSPGERGVVID